MSFSVWTYYPTWDDSTTKWVGKGKKRRMVRRTPPPEPKARQKVLRALTGKGNRWKTPKGGKWEGDGCCSPIKRKPHADVSFSFKRCADAMAFMRRMRKAGASKVYTVSHDAERKITKCPRKGKS